MKSPYVEKDKIEFENYVQEKNLLLDTDVVDNRFGKIYYIKSGSNVVEAYTDDDKYYVLT